ncbi:hypothetical protein H310_13881 [Aphanomyces invadans]|uniref:Uncharacterized protein n=1 Tax=Aphanomyces invadans TaxID=157072 RepID=A0A024TC55_9STRA|nr:hypothetical protein H310_13881 [Aphanomyces invadans]ETV91633.1 hypothetical protein H310_13881 [Aphanomyces invadans]|eukprot:XP_008879752.1 hypothetical protein H310_13881 [Aphanomyces invadans]
MPTRQCHEYLFVANTSQQPYMLPTRRLYSSNHLHGFIESVMAACHYKVDLRQRVLKLTWLHLRFEGGDTSCVSNARLEGGRFGTSICWNDLKSPRVGISSRLRTFPIADLFMQPILFCSPSSKLVVGCMGMSLDASRAARSSASFAISTIWRWHASTSCTSMSIGTTVSMGFPSM